MTKTPRLRVDYMKTFRKYLYEHDGLADMGQQDLAADIENPQGEEQDSDTDPVDELSIVRKCMRIAMGAGDQHKNRINSFLKRLSRDIPELQNLVSQLESDDEPSGEDRDEPKGAAMVSTPASDVPPAVSTN
jgi:hypothetical protein